MCKITDIKRQEGCSSETKVASTNNQKQSSLLPQFPSKLHDMLHDSEGKGFQHIVSWMPDGNGFRIHDPEELTKILKVYFKQTKYKSFLRQLQNYGFQRVIKGPRKGICQHPKFVRGQRNLCHQIKRVSRTQSSTALNNSTNTTATSNASTNNKSKPALHQRTSPSTTSASKPNNDSNKRQTRSSTASPVVSSSPVKPTVAPIAPAEPVPMTKNIVDSFHFEPTLIPSSDLIMMDPLISNIPPCDILPEMTDSLISKLPPCHVIFPDPEDAVVVPPSPPSSPEPVMEQGLFEGQTFFLF